MHQVCCLPFQVDVAQLRILLCELRSCRMASCPDVVKFRRFLSFEIWFISELPLVFLPFVLLVKLV